MSTEITPIPTPEEVSTENPTLPASSDAGAPIPPTESDGGASSVVMPQESSSEAPTSAAASLDAAVTNAEDAVIEEKKAVENNVHPMARELHTIFEGDWHRFLSWAEQEWNKI